MNNHKPSAPHSMPPPTYGFTVPPPAAPPSYAQAVGGVPPSSPYQPQYVPGKIFFSS